MSRFWDSLLAPAPQRRCDWEPPADVYSGPRRWLVKLDLAGVRPEDVEIVVSGRRLVVRGVRRDFSVHEGRRAYSMEIAYSRFERSIDLPVDLDRSRIRTEYRDGMFYLEIAVETDE